MNPPAYSVQEQFSSPRRSIQDLRTQILANVSIMRSASSSSIRDSDWVELIMCKAPAAPSVSQTSKAPMVNTAGVSAFDKRANTNWTEKKTQYMMRGLIGGQVATHDLTLPSHASSSQAALSESGGGGRHYAVLIKNSSQRGNIILVMKGEQRSTIEGALECILEKIEMLTHDLVVRRGKPLYEVCCIM